MQPDYHPNPETVHNPLSVMQPDEQVICEIRRTGIGLVPVYLSGGALVLAIAAVTILAPQFITDMSAQFKLLLLAVFGLVSLLALLFVYIAVVVYRANRWVLTSDSLTQIAQTGLFNKHASQLSLANLEDVTADQRGILQSMLNYGTLNVETAGEHSKFHFPYCPNPNYYGQQILLARENFIRNEPAAAKTSNGRLNLPRTPQSQ